MRKWFSSQVIINVCLVLCFILLGVVTVVRHFDKVILYLNLSGSQVYFRLACLLSVLTNIITLLLNYNILRVLYKFTRFELSKTLIFRSYLLSAISANILVLLVPVFTDSLVIHALVGGGIFFLVFALVTYVTLRSQTLVLKQYLLICCFGLLNLAFTMVSVVFQGIDAFGI